MTDERMSRLADAYIAIKDHGWNFSPITSSRKILVPPLNDERRGWTAMWDEDGIPHWMPKFSKGEK